MKKTIMQHFTQRANQNRCKGWSVATVALFSGTGIGALLKAFAHPHSLGTQPERKRGDI